MNRQHPDHASLTMRRQALTRPCPRFVDIFLDHFCQVSASTVHPARFYRYRSCDTAYFEEELRRAMAASELFFPSQLQVNDPFDCQPVMAKGVTLDEYRTIVHPVLCAIRTEMGRELSGESIAGREMCRIIERNRASVELATIAEEYESRLDRMITDMFSSIGILSLTIDNNNPVMWSMYGARGNGVCIELEQVFIARHSHTIVPVQVHYSQDRPPFDYLGAIALFLYMTPRAAQYVAAPLRPRLLRGLAQLRYSWTKHEHWRYENEYRLLAYKGGGSYVHIPGVRITGIYVGDRVATDTRRRIASIADGMNSGIAVHVGSRSTSAYAIEFERLA